MARKPRSKRRIEPRFSEKTGDDIRVSKADRVGAGPKSRNSASGGKGKVAARKTQILNPRAWISSPPSVYEKPVTKPRTTPTPAKKVNTSNPKPISFVTDTTRRPTFDEGFDSNHRFNPHRLSSTGNPLSFPSRSPSRTSRPTLGSISVDRCTATSKSTRSSKLHASLPAAICSRLNCLHCAPKANPSTYRDL